MGKARNHFVGLTLRRGWSAGPQHLELIRFSGRFTAWVSCSVPVGSLEVDGSPVTQALVTPVWVIPPLDVGEDLSLCVAMVVEANSVEELAFETGKKVLGHGVVVAVPDRARRSAPRCRCSPANPDNACMAAWTCFCGRDPQRSSPTTRAIRGPGLRQLGAEGAGSGPSAMAQRGHKVGKKGLFERRIVGNQYRGFEPTRGLL